MLKNRYFAFGLAVILSTIIIVDYLHAAQGLASNSIDTPKAPENLPISLIQYKVIFDQITPEQHTKFRAFYTQYSGYSQHQIVSQNAKVTVMNYMSQAPTDLLVNNFSKTADYLGMQVLVRQVDQTIGIRLVKLSAKSLPYKEW